MARPKRFELLTPRFVVSSDKLIQQQFPANRHRKSYPGNNGLAGVLQNFLSAKGHQTQLGAHEVNTEEYSKRFGILSSAGVGVVLTRTREPFRAIEALKMIAFSQNPARQFLEWTVLSGWKTHSRIDPDTEVTGDMVCDPFPAMKNINDAGNAVGQHTHALYVMMYPHKHLNQGHPGMIQVLKEYVHTFSATKKRLILITPLGFNLPQELEDDITILDFEVASYSELETCFDNTISLLDRNEQPRIDAELKKRLVSLGAGMTMMEFETALSRALITNYDSLPNVEGDALANVVASVKTEVVKRSEVLELMEAESMANVGGLDLLKGWMAKRQTAFSDEARAFGIEPPKGIALIGPPGCVSGSTVLNLRRGKRNHGREITIADAYAKLHGEGDFGGAQWRQGLECFVPAMLDDRIGYHRVVDIVKSGVKETFVIIADNGYAMRVSAEHRFKVPDGTRGADFEGFKMLKHLMVGDKVIVRSNDKYQGGRKPNRPRRIICSLPHHPHGWANVVAGKDYKRITHARLVLEARMNNLSVNEMVMILRKDPDTAATLSYLDPALEVHHLDGDPMNDDPANLMPLTKELHLSEHTDEKQKNFGDVLYREETIRSIRPYRQEMTYDLVMAEPYRNYVAQGFVVHNSDNSLATEGRFSGIGKTVRLKVPRS